MEPPCGGRYEATPRRGRRGRPAAAMEPPGEGRYEVQPPPMHAGLDPAAMEPPGEGRYEDGRCVDADQCERKPQWSRPVKGGTSRNSSPAWKTACSPQWSRPVKGGTRAGWTVGYDHDPSAAMEPPGEGRYELPDERLYAEIYLPQWSRPVKGGTRTHARRDPPRPPHLAAMEPPGEGRYEPIPLVGVGGRRERRNGAAR